MYGQAILDHGRIMGIGFQVSVNMQPTIWKHVQSAKSPVFWSILKNQWREDCMDDNEIKTVDVY